MAIVALHSAASGLSALSTNLDIIANNLANVNTNGFKGTRANFEDLLYQEKQQAGVENANGDQRPAGLYVGLGTRISNTQYDQTQGSAIATGRDIDFMIDGKGFFKVSTLESVGNGTAYTRAGNFFVNKDGSLVLGNSDGPLLNPPITVPENATVSVSSDGVVYAMAATDTAPTQVGQISLVNFVNPAGLKSVGGNLYVETGASGTPIEGNPGSGNFGSIKGGFLESSNVDPVKELITLIKTQRAFEMNSQSIRAADETLQVVSNLRR